MPLMSVDADFYGGTRTRTSRSLPEYFLLVDLLGFRCLGKAEKVAWSIPLELDGQLLHVEHRKLGLGIFSSGDANSEAAAEEVVRLIHKGLRVARPYLDWCAEKAVNDSRVTIINRSIELYDRFEFLLEEYKSKLTAAYRKAGEPEISAHAGSSIAFNLPACPRPRVFSAGLSTYLFSWPLYKGIALVGSPLRNSQLLIGRKNFG